MKGYAIQSCHIVTYDEERDTGTCEFTTEWVGMKKPSNLIVWYHSLLNRFPVRVIEFELPYEQIKEKG